MRRPWKRAVMEKWLQVDLALHIVLIHTSELCEQNCRKTLRILCFKGPLFVSLLQHVFYEDANISMSFDEVPRRIRVSRIPPAFTDIFWLTTGGCSHSWVLLLRSGGWNEISLWQRCHCKLCMIVSFSCFPRPTYIRCTVNWHYLGILAPDLFIWVSVSVSKRGHTFVLA